MILYVVLMHEVHLAELNATTTEAQMSLLPLFGFVLIKCAKKLTC